MPRKSLISFLNLFSFRFLQKDSTRRRKSRNRLIGTRPSAIESLEALEDRTLLSVSVTLATTSLSASATEVVINGTDFDPIVSNNSVSFNRGAVGVVTAATATSLTVTFTTEPSSAGNLTAVVTSNSVSSGSPVQIATVVPDVISNPASIPANETTLLIDGDGFDTTASNNTVTFNNGAVGTVSAATATLLTVTLTTPPTTAGPLNATVVTNGASSTATQVATVAPVVTSSSAFLAANANTVIIAGLGFDSTPSNGSVTFDNGAVGAITAATATSLTVNLTTRPVTAGSFTAVVTSNGVSSGAPVQVALVKPVVTSSTAQVAANASTITINGFGFDPTVANNAVTLNNGAAGTITSATPTSMTVSFSTKPSTAGSLTAIVTTNSQNSGSATQIAAITPVVTSSTASLAANAATVVIAGLGFDTTAANNTVTLSSGAVGTVISSTATSMTVGFDTAPETMGSLTAIVTTNSLDSGSGVQVATVKPVVTSNTSNLLANAATMTIAGFGFDSTTPSNNTVQFNNGAVGSVTAATTTSLTISFSTRPKAAGSLTAIVTTGGQTSGTAVQIATVRPVITSSTGALAANSNTLTISGFGFDPIASRNTVVLNNNAVGTVTAATNTSLTVTFSTRPATAGSLTVIATTNSQNSGTALQIAEITPVVTGSTASLLANANTLTISGFGFDPTAANNSVAFNNGAVGTIASATATSLTVTLTTKPTRAGSLTAIVTTNSETSGSATQIATVTPVVLANTGNILRANATTLTIIGSGFDTTLVNNTVTFNNGVIGSVSAASATTLTITLSTRPTSVGSLSAIVVTNGVSSGAAMVVAAVVPSVTTSTSSLAANASTLTITGLAFSATASQNTVVFNNGAVGTVTAATTTSLVVTFSAKPAASGSLTAIVTTNSMSSGPAIQVATVTPVISSSTTNLAANASTVSISGFGFHTVPSRNIVTFNNGAEGVVTAATATSLTVTFSAKPAAAGTLTASITSNSIAGSSGVSIAHVRPVVTTNTTARLAANSSTLIITGTGFSTNPVNNTVIFNNGAAGTVTAATATTLTVNLTTAPTSAGSLTVIVTTNSRSSGAAVQVSTVVPVVSTSTSSLLADDTTLSITGFGFDTTAANNTVVFNNGAVGTVTAASATSLTVTFSTKPTSPVALTAIVTSNGVNSGAAIQVATVFSVVTSSSATVAADATSVTVNGLGFDSIAANNTVTFNNGAEGTVTSASATSLTVTFTTNPTAAGALTAVVESNSLSSGSAVEIANVVPVVTAETSNFITANTNTLTIYGIGFDTTAANNTVTFNNGAVGTVDSASATSLSVTFTTLPATAGPLTAVVATNGMSSGSALQVATVIPVVTTSNVNIAANATTITISGFGFDPVPLNNIVVFNNDAIGTVTTATETLLTITLSTSPTTAGDLTAVVTTNTLGSGTAKKVATVIPVVTSSTASLSANGSTLVINGFGFDATAVNNTVTLNNGAVGDVSSASATSITVTFSTKPATAGSLTAIVTTGGISNASAVQVASVTPVVTSSSINLAADADTLTINGFGFDTTAANNTVVFNNGAVGTVTEATATTLTITFSTRPDAAGSLTAVVTTNSVSSGAAIEVATVIPVVTTNTSHVAVNAATLVINGFGFDTTAANNSVVFNNGAVGTVTAATATTLTVTFSFNPAAAGSLTAVVTTNGVSSGSAVQVANARPVVTVRTVNQSADATTVTINGSGFNPTASQNLVAFNNNAIGTVTAATKTSLVVTFSIKPRTAGSLTAIVVTNGIASGTATQVASVIPVVTSSTSSLAANATTLTINGLGFDPVANRNTVSFNNGAAGTVTAATATSLTVTLSTRPTTAGSLTAVVTTNSMSSGTAVQVATVTPVVTATNSNLLANAATLTITGFGFDPTPANNTVVLNSGAVGTVTTATATVLTVTFSTRPASVGSLTAIVTTNGVSSGAAIQVATVIPMVTSSTVNLAANSNTVTINGFAFDPVASRNVVVFNNGAIGTVTAATQQALTVTFSTRPTSAGSLTAVVTTNSIVNGAAVQIANVIPKVTSSNASLGANSATIAISGFGFSTTAASNTVVFSGGVVGTVTAATTTLLTVTLSSRPTIVGNLTAVVTTNSLSSGSAVQVATVVPTVTSSTTALATGTTTLTIAGFGFSSTITNNSIAFNNGAVGIITAATTTSLSVTLAALPNIGGPLTVVVTTGAFSSAATPIATVAPVVTSTTTSIAATGNTVTISGSNFSPIAANNTVVFDRGAIGAVTSATTTSLTVTFSTKPATAGSLTAIVTTSGISSGTAVQVATVTPIVTSSTTSLGINAATMVISGFGFDLVAAKNTVVMNNGAVGTVTAASATSLTVTFSTKPTALGSLTAVVTSNLMSSGAAVQIATVAPAVTVSTATLAANAATVTITGAGFSTVAANNTVAFNNGAVGTVTTATATSLIVTFSTKPQTVGGLTAIVTTNGTSSGAAVQVANVIPVVTANTANLAITSNTITISGFGFSTVAANNRVVFNNGAVGTVTAATATTLTITFTTRPTRIGSLTAVLTTNLLSSGLAVQVANVI